MIMSLNQQIITVVMIVLGTMITRFLPFLIFPCEKNAPKFIRYLGSVLPGAVFGMLVVYCLKNTSFTSGNFAIPEIVSLTTVVLIHLWKRKMLISILSGTVLYMFLVQTIF